MAFLWQCHALQIEQDDFVILEQQVRELVQASEGGEGKQAEQPLAFLMLADLAAVHLSRRSGRDAGCVLQNSVVELWDNSVMIVGLGG